MMLMSCLQLFHVAFPDLLAPKTHWWWVAVDDGSAEFVLAFEGEDFSWRWGSACSVVELAERFVVCGGACCDGHLLCEAALVGVGFGVVVDGDFFAVAFVDVHVWGEVLAEGRGGWLRR